MEIEIIDEIEPQIDSLETYIDLYKVPREQAEIDIALIKELEFQDYISDRGSIEEVIIKKIVQLDILIQKNINRFGHTNAMNKIFYPVTTNSRSKQSYTVMFDSPTNVISDKEVHSVANAKPQNVIGLKYTGYFHQVDKLLHYNKQEIALLHLRPYNILLTESLKFHTLLYNETDINVIFNILLNVYLESPAYFNMYYEFAYKHLMAQPYYHNYVYQDLSRTNISKRISLTPEQSKFLSELGLDVNNLGSQYYSRFFMAYNFGNIENVLNDIRAEKEMQRLALVNQRSRETEYNLLIRWKTMLSKITNEDYSNYQSLSLLTGALKSDIVKKIKDQITKEDNWINAVVNNKCPHVKLYFKLRKEQKSYIQDKLLTELKQFFIDGDTYIKCKNCGFDIICPHVVALLENKKDLKKRDDVIQLYSGAEVGLYKCCKICFETISKRYDDVLQFGDVNFVENDELKHIIWKEINRLFSYIRLDGFFDINRLVLKIMGNIYPLIFKVQVKYSKIKTMVESDVTNRVEMYSFIYAFANLYSIIVKLPPSVKMSIKGGNTIENVMNIINNVKNVAIKGMDIKMKDIKSLLEASINSLDYNIEIDNPYTESVVSLIDSPIYTWLYDMYNLKNGKVSFKLSNKINKIESVLNATFDEIICNPYAKLEHLKGKNEDVNLTLDYLMGKQVSFKDKGREQVIMRFRNKGFSKIPFVRESVFEYIDVPLAYIYDDNGMDHKWNKIIISESNSKTVAISESEFNAKHLGPADIKDYKCSICGWKKSELDKIDDKRIMEGIIHRNQFNDFSIYYAVRCPEGNSHKFIIGKVLHCAKCGLEKFNDEYFNKYYKNYVESLKKKIKPTFYVDKSVEQIMEVPDIPDIEKTYVAKYGLNGDLIPFIGHSTYKDVEKILSGAIQPAELLDKIDYRIGIIFGYIRQIIIQYNKIKYSNNKKIVMEDIRRYFKLTSTDPKNFKMESFQFNPDELHKALLKSLDKNELYTKSKNVLFGTIIFVSEQGKIGDMLAKEFSKKIIDDIYNNSAAEYIPWKLIRETETEEEAVELETDEPEEDEEDNPTRVEGHDMY